MSAIANAIRAAKVAYKEEKGRKTSSFEIRYTASEDNMPCTVKCDTMQDVADAMLDNTRLQEVTFTVVEIKPAINQAVKAVKREVAKRKKAEEALSKLHKNLEGLLLVDPK